MFTRAFFPFAILIIQTAVAFPAAGTQPTNADPDLSEARVTIPYPEIKALWAAAQQNHNKKEDYTPPVESTIVSARYQIALSSDQATGIADFDIQGFTDHWTVIPLLGTDAQIESIEPVDLQIFIRDKYYALASNRPAKQTVSIKFAVKLVPSDDGTQLRLPIAPASINTLTVTGVPQKQALRVTNGTQVSGNKTGATFRLAPQDHIELNLVPEQSLAAPIPSHWKIEPQAFVQFTDGKLLYQTRIAAHADNGSALAMDLQFPPDANVINITRADIDGWQVKSGENQSQVAHIQWKMRDVLRRELDIVYDLPQPLTAPQWKLLSPQVEGESSPPLYVLALAPGLELTPPPASPVPRQLPHWLAERAQEINFLVYAGDKPLQARWLPLVSTPRAVAETVQANTHIVPDGAVITELAYDIRHETAYSWKLTLPKGAELLASSVDGRGVNPIDCGEGGIQFSLPAGRTASEVKLSYTAKGAVFKPVSGKIVIDLPQTELLTSKLDWALRIPAAYEVAAFEGNVEPNPNSGQADADSRTILLHREIFKGEQPNAELYYQKIQADK